MKKALVAFYSYSGTTKRIAEMIQKELRCDIYEIVETYGYSRNYSELLKQAKKQIKRGDMVGLKGDIPDLAGYDMVFIGSPNWWNTIAPPVSSFLMQADLNGKTIVPFITHGGGGLGRSTRYIRELCRNARVLDGIDANQWNRVLEWLKNK